MAFDALRSPVCSGRLFIALGRWLICTVFVYAAAGAGAQIVPFQQVPEFEMWIQEADKSKKDPVDFVQAMREVGLVTFAQSRYFNKYLLARIVAENAELDAKLKKSKDNLENTTRLLVSRYGELLTLFESLKVRNTITAVEVLKIRNIYNDTATPPDMRQRIEMNFGTELKLYSK